MSLNSQDYATIGTAVVTIASALANFFPHPKDDRVKGIVRFIATVVSVLALNFKDLTKPVE